MAFKNTRFEETAKSAALLPWRGRRTDVVAGPVWYDRG